MNKTLETKSDTGADTRSSTRLEDRWHGGIRPRILLPFALLLIFMMGAFVVSAYLERQRDFKNILRESAQNVNDLFLGQIDTNTRIMESTIGMILRDPAIREAFVQRDRETLLRRAAPLFAELKAKRCITHFYFTGPDRVNFMRVHMPDRHGDVIDRITTLSAEKSNAVTHGVEMGPLGTMTLRVVAPWRDGNKLLGYVELGSEVENLCQNIESTLGIEVFVLADKRLLDPTLWTQGMAMLDRKGQWDDFPALVYVGGSRQQIPTYLASKIKGAKAPDQLPALVEVTQTRLATFLPIKDVADKIIGYFAISRDVTALQESFRNSVLILLFVCTLTGSIVFVVFYGMLGRVDAVLLDARHRFEARLRERTRELTDEIAYRKRTEEQVRLSEEKYREFVENAGDAIIAADAETGLIISANPSAARLLGMPVNRIVGLDQTQIHPRGEEDLYRKLFQDAVKAGRWSGNNLFLRRADGSPVPVEVHSTTFDLQGRKVVEGIFQNVTDRKMREEEQTKRDQALRHAMLQTVQTVGATVEKRDPYTAGHQRRVSELAVRIGREMGLSDIDTEGLRMGGLIHDIGKIYIPSEVLTRPGRFSSEEFNLVKTHCKVGHDIMKDADLPWPLAQMILQHHERMDGSGYPQGLKGPQIITEARILAVADVVEAMASHRPYRPGKGIDAALDEIKRGRDTAYDPAVVDACLSIFARQDGRDWFQALLKESMA